MGCCESKGAPEGPASATENPAGADGNNDGAFKEAAKQEAEATAGDAFAEQMEKSGEEIVEDLAATQQALMEAVSRMPNPDAASFGIAKAILTLVSAVNGTDFKISLTFPIEFAVRVFFNAAIGVSSKSEFLWGLLHVLRGGGKQNNFETSSLVYGTICR
jgi:hypothetical protein